MKFLKYIFGLCLSILFILSCNEDDNQDYLNNVVAPSNISALLQITQDNTGLVTITPNGDGVVSFDVDFGDGTVESENVKIGESTTHTYAEGTYNLRLVGNGITGLTTEATQEVVVSFNPPENLVVTIENDAAVSKQVNVTATADNAMSFDVYFGETGNDTPVTANIGEIASYTYEEAGAYTIRVVAKGGAIATTEYTEEFLVTEILQPIVSAPIPPTRGVQDVVSMFSDAYTDVNVDTWRTPWSDATFEDVEIDGNPTKKYSALNFVGIETTTATIDASTMTHFHTDIWSPNLTEFKIKLVDFGANGVFDGGDDVEHEITIANPANGEWVSLDIPLADFTGLTTRSNIAQLIYVGAPSGTAIVFVDNVYFHKPPEPASGLEGIWKLAPQAGAFKVGPTPGSGDWFTSDDQTVIDRACFFDDEYVFSLDGSFSNVLGSETWLEAWQGVASDQCGLPVAPHDGTVAATYIYDDGAGTVTLNGTGAYLVLPKVNNDGELPNVPVPGSITYDVILTNNNNDMEVSIESGTGVFWTYKLIREVPVIAGTWRLASEAGAFKVGPAPGSGDWFTSDDQTVIDRACFFDDEYVFSSDGSFSNVLGSETWLEAWQGVVSDQCGTPVSPHDGTGAASYVYNEGTSTITLNGSGAYLVLSKVNNDGELPNVPVPGSITYDIILTNNNNDMEVRIEAGTGVFWTYKLVR
ncbi:PKD domain-containing protein [uncultured Aquimarina sp.]|uniref:PKD domain-containing protein n=1 Tax=uncultured Aquimarina sp. TaxID=575652 RepID=UPI002609D2AB|nr:PKD domain-containing protein [uncultured Aquimarina sp.]